MKINKLILDRKVYTNHLLDAETLEEVIGNMFFFAYFNKIQNIAFLSVMSVLSLAIGFMLYMNILSGIVITSLEVIIVAVVLIHLVKLKSILRKNNLNEINDYNNKVRDIKLYDDSGHYWKLLINEEKCFNKRQCARLDIFLSNEMQENSDNYWRKKFDLDKMFKFYLVDNEYNYKSLFLILINKLSISKELAKRELMDTINQELENIAIYYDIYEDKHFVLMKKSLIPEGYKEIFDKICEKLLSYKIFEMMVSATDEGFKKEKEDRERRKQELNEIINYEKMIPNWIREKDLKSNLTTKEDVSVEKKRKKI